MKKGIIRGNRCKVRRREVRREKKDREKDVDMEERKKRRSNCNSRSSKLTMGPVLSSFQSSKYCLLKHVYSKLTHR